MKPDRRNTVPPQTVDVQMDQESREDSPTKHISGTPKDPGAVAGGTAAEGTLPEAQSPNPAGNIAREAKDPSAPPKEVGFRDDDRSRFDEPQTRSLNVGPDRRPGAEGEPTTEDVGGEGRSDGA